MRKNWYNKRHASICRVSLSGFTRIYLLYLKVRIKHFAVIIRRVPWLLWLGFIVATAVASPRIFGAATWTTQQLVILYDHVAENASGQAGTRLLTSIDVLLIWLALPFLCKEPHQQFYSQSVFYFHQTHRTRVYTASILTIGTIQAYVVWLLIFSPVTWVPFLDRMAGFDIVRRLLVDVMGIGICVIIAMAFSGFQFWLEARQIRLLWLWTTTCIFYAVPPATVWGISRSMESGSDFKTTITLLVQMSDRDGVYVNFGLCLLIWTTIIGFVIPATTRFIGRYGAERKPD